MTDAMQITVSSEIAKRMEASNSRVARMPCERSHDREVEGLT
jgi:hypothetical protein